MWVFGYTKNKQIKTHINLWKPCTFQYEERLQILRHYSNMLWKSRCKVKLMWREHYVQFCITIDKHGSSMLCWARISIVPCTFTKVWFEIPNSIMHIADKKYLNIYHVSFVSLRDVGLLLNKATEHVWCNMLGNADC